MEDTWYLKTKSGPGRAEIPLLLNIFLTNSKEWHETIFPNLKEHNEESRNTLLRTSGKSLCQAICMAQPGFFKIKESDRILKY